MLQRGKRFLSLLLVCALAISGLQMPVVTVQADTSGTSSATETSSETAKASDFTTSGTSGALTITGYTGTATDLDLTEIFKGSTIVSIGSEAFKENKTLNSVVIPDSCTTISQVRFIIAPI